MADRGFGVGSGRLSARVRRGVVAPILAAVLAVAGGAHAQPTKPVDKAVLDEAKERFKSGMLLYQEGSLDGALAELQRAYQLSLNWKILYNIGVIYRDQRNYVESIKAYERFLADGGKQVEPAKVKEVQKDLEQVRRFIAHAEIVTNFDGADVRLDDDLVGTSPLKEPLAVNAGKHRFSASLHGHTDAVETVQFAGGDKVRVELKLGEPPPPPTAAEANPGSTPATERIVVVGPPPGPPVLPIILLATGGVALVAAGVFGGLTLTSRSDASESCKDTAGGHLCNANARSDLDREKTLGLVTDISLIGGIVLAGLGTYLLVTSRREPARASSGITLAGRARLGGFELAGSF